MTTKNKTTFTTSDEGEFTVWDISRFPDVFYYHKVLKINSQDEYTELEKSPTMMMFDRNGNYINDRKGRTPRESNLLWWEERLKRFNSSSNPRTAPVDGSREHKYTIFFTQSQLDYLLETYDCEIIEWDAPFPEPNVKYEYLYFRKDSPIHIGELYTPEAAAAFHFDKKREPQPDDKRQAVFYAPSDRDYARTTYHKNSSTIQRKPVSNFTFLSLGVCHTSLFQIFSDTLLGKTSSVLTEMLRLHANQEKQIGTLTEAVIHLNSKLPVKDRLSKATIKAVNEYAPAAPVSLAGPIALQKQLDGAQAILDSTQFQALHDTFNSRNKAKDDNHDYHILALRALDPGYDALVDAAIKKERARRVEAGEKMTDEDEPIVEPEAETPAPETAPETIPEPAPETPTAEPEAETPDPVAEIEIPDGDVSSS